MKPLEQLRKTLKKHGRSLTHPREAVFMALQNQEALSINELVAACPAIDRVSIYRSINLFEDLAIVQRLQLGWKYKLELTGDFREHHHHLVCLNCGRVIHFDEDKVLEARFKRIAQANNFALQDHQLEIQGLCANCHKS